MTTETTQETAKRERIAELNDLCRKAPGIAGRWLETQGIQALGEQARSAIRERIETYSDFGPDNNPWGERDFGALIHEGNKIFWKIDYYDRTMTWGSEDPTDPKQTVRVLTVMLAEEY